MDKKLFTPGPLSCSASVKEAMLRDLGSRDSAFVETIHFVRTQLLHVAGVDDPEYTCVPLQGSGTYAVEAALQTAVPRNNGQVLILANGAYGLRMKQICDIAKISNTILSFPEDQRVCLEKVEELLQQGVKFDAVAVVHCETTSGIINPVTQLGQLIKKYLPHSMYIVDAMSSFGGVDIDFHAADIDFLISSSNKCIQGVPGLAFVIAKRDQLEQCAGNCRVLTLDLFSQYRGLEGSGQFRFTPPTHVILALKQAILELKAEGGVPGRAQRYANNCNVLREGMKKLGFKTYLREDLSDGYIITSFWYPNHPNFNFEEFYQRLSDLGQIIYPGKVSTADCFRIGSIGHLFPEDFERLLTCVGDVLNAMNVHVPF